VIELVGITLRVLHGPKGLQLSILCLSLIVSELNQVEMDVAENILQTFKSPMLSDRHEPSALVAALE